MIEALLQEALGYGVSEGEQVLGTSELQVARHLSKVFGHDAVSPLKAVL